MQHVRQVVTLSGGSVTLKAWGANVADGHLLDLLTFTALIGGWAQAGLTAGDTPTFDTGELEQPRLLTVFDRLAEASALTPLPRPLSYRDLLTLAGAMWELNDVEDAAGKLMALTSRAQHRMDRIRQMEKHRQAPASQGHPTPP